MTVTNKYFLRLEVEMSPVFTFIILFYVYGCFACMSIYVLWTWVVSVEARKALDLLELELQMVVGIREEWELNPGKSSKCS